MVSHPRNETHFTYQQETTTGTNPLPL